MTIFSKNKKKIDRKNKLRMTFIWVIFILFFICYVAIEIELRVILSIWSIGLAIFLLINEKIPSIKSIFVSILFSVLASFAYIGLGLEIEDIIIPSFFTIISTFICAMAVFTIIEKSNQLKFLVCTHKTSWLRSILIGLSVGLLLSIINYFLMKNSSDIDFHINFSRVFLSLNPAIYEEIVCRAIFFAYFTYLSNEEETTGFYKFTCWFMSVFPHTLSHNYDIISSIILSVLFGLPFAFLQKKRDIVSAMVSHGVVDAVRFCIFGISA